MSELHRWASAALSWIDEIYPADIFDGSSGDEGPVRIVEIRENLRQALTDTTNPGQGAPEPLWDANRMGQECKRNAERRAAMGRNVPMDTIVKFAYEATLATMRDEYEAERATLTERIAMLEAQLTEARKPMRLVVQPDFVIDLEDE